MRRFRIAGGLLGAAVATLIAISAAGSESWVALTIAGPTPGARFHHAMAYDAANDRAILFGGARPSNGAPLNDVWILDHASGLTGTPAWTHASLGHTYGRRDHDETLPGGLP